MAGGYQTWPLIQFGVIGEAWRLYKRHWVVWSLAMLIVLACYGVRDRRVAGVLSACAISRAGRLPAVPDARRHTLPFCDLQRRQQVSSWAE